MDGLAVIVAACKEQPYEWAEQELGRPLTNREHYRLTSLLMLLYRDEIEAYCRENGEELPWTVP